MGRERGRGTKRQADTEAGGQREAGTQRQGAKRSRGEEAGGTEAKGALELSKEVLQLCLILFSWFKKFLRNMRHYGIEGGGESELVYDGATKYLS